LGLQLRRILDLLLGYDFFISYSHADGEDYPANLAERLHSQSLGYKVFLDREGYVAGDNLRLATQRRVRMSRYLIIVAGPHAMDSIWVRREVNACLKYKRIPIVIDLDRTFHNASLENDLKQLLIDSVRIDESMRDDQPSDATITQLQEAFHARRQDSVRMRLAAVLVFVFALIAGLAIWQYYSAESARKEAEHRARVARSRELSANAERLVESNPVKAMSFAIEGAKTHENIETWHALDLCIRNSHERAGFLHRNLVVHAAFSPSSRTLATASWDGTARVFSIPEFEPEQVFSFEKQSAIYVEYSPDGAELLVLCERGLTAYCIQDGAEGHIMRMPDTSFGGGQYSPSGDCIVFAAGMSLYLVDRSTWTYRKWDIGRDVIADLDFSHDGRRVVAAELFGVARIINVRTGEEERSLDQYARSLASVDFSPIDARVVVASRYDQVRIFDGMSGEVLHVLEGHAAGTWNAEFSPDGRHVVTFAEDGFVRLFDSENGKEIASHGVGASKLGREAHYDHEGRRVLVEMGASVAILGSDNLELIRVLHGAERPAFFSPDGRWIASCGRDNFIRVFDTVSGPEHRTLAVHSRKVLDAAFSKDGDVVATACSDGIVRVYDSSSGVEALKLTGHSAAITSVEFEPGDRNILTASADGTARLFDRETGRLIRTLSGHEGAVRHATYSPNGRWIVTAGVDGTARLYERFSDEPRHILAGHIESKTGLGGGVAYAEFSRDSRLVVTAGGDGTARIHDVELGTEIHKLTVSVTPLRGGRDDPWGESVALRGRVKIATFNPNGDLVATACSDNRPRIFSVRNGELVHELIGHGEEICSVEFSPDGDHLLTASMDASARIFDVRSGKELRRSTGVHGVQRARYSPDGERVAVATNVGGEVWLYESQGMEVLRTVRAGSGQIWDAVFAPLGDVIVAYGAKTPALIYPASLERLVQQAESRLPVRPDPSVTVVSLSPASLMPILQEE
jgi:WD40 repeat protein